MILWLAGSILFPAKQIIAQDFSNKGKDFWIGYGNHVRMFNNTPLPGTGCVTQAGGAQVCPETMEIYVTSDVNTTGFVEIPSIGFNQNFTITANTITTVVIPRQAALGDEGLYNHGIHIVAQQPIVVYSFIYVNAVSGATVCLPTNVLGRDYYSLNYTQVSNEQNSYSYFFVVATEDNTTVEITPSADTKGGRLANIPFTVTLNKGQIYQVLGRSQTGPGPSPSGVDLTGSRIRSISSGTSGCKKIAVFSGSGKISLGCNAPNTSYHVAGSSDNLYQQMYPTSAWGKKYITVPTTNQTSTLNFQTNIFRVMLSDPATTVRLNGTVVPAASFVNGSYYQFSSNTTNIIEADKPVMVAQYFTTQQNTQNANCGNSGNGDPEMIFLNPVEQVISSVTLNSMQPNTGTNLNAHFINVVLPNAPGAINSFLIDGVSYASRFVPLPQDNKYAYARINVSRNTHNITCDSGFNAIAYGFGNAESYGYSAGTNVKDLYQFISIKNEYGTVNFPATCVNAPFFFGITLPYQPTKLVWKFNGVFPDTTLDNPKSDSSYQVDGRTIYRYRLPSSYTYKTQGTQKVTVLATNPTSDGCSGEQQIDYDVQVFAAPVADFDWQYTVCTLDSVRFNDKSSSGGRAVTNYLWEFGDLTTGNSKNPVKKYLAPGIYNLKESIVTDIGCLASAQKTIEITQAPAASFTTGTLRCEDQDLSFTNNSIANYGNITRWQWDMGDGTQKDLSNGNPFAYKYTNSGTPKVTLVVSTDKGCVSAPFSQDIVVNPRPAANFDLPEVCLNDAFALFNNTTTVSDGTGAQLSFYWTFGDPNANASNPNSSTIRNAQHRYTATGNYSVFMRAASIYGCLDSVTQTLTVNGDKPKADFNIQNTGNICSTVPVTIQNKSTVNFGDVTKVEIYWEWPSTTVKTIDDQPAFDKIYQHYYPVFSKPATKNYQIRLVAYSGGICVNELIKPLTLQAKPDVWFQQIPGICLDAAPRIITQAADLSGLPGTGVYSGLGVSANGQINPSTAGVGQHPVTYVHTSAAGCADTASQPITVWPRPTATFSVDAPTCVTLNVVFRDASVPNHSALKQWLWTFGDGSSLTRNDNQPFAHVYAATGNVTVQLQVTTDSGCVSVPASRSVRINPLPQVDFSLPVVCMPSGKADFTDRSTIADGSQAQFTYAWTFGVPGSFSSSMNPTYFYPAVGSYTVQLVVTSKDGCRDSASKMLTDVNPQPMANFAIDPASVCLGDGYTFTGQNNPLNQTITAYFWSFGDGTTANTANASHTYKQAGTFNVSHYYVTSKGCHSDTLVKPAVVHPYPVVNAGPDLVMLEGGQVTIAATATGSSSYQYLWTPATSLSSAAVLQPVAKPANDITYTLTVTGTGGCKSSDNVFIKVLFSPVIPTAFSPNGDGINDTWTIRYLDSYPGATVKVFDRYGRLVYNSVGYNSPWNGNFNGAQLPTGVYYYVIDPKNGRKVMQGSVTLIR